MDDQVYAERLFAILTNPEPTGVDPDDPYGQAEDGIDRYDGFGRDVWVESVAVADGAHGAELVVEFGLALSPRAELSGVPRVGTLRLPLDARWRELSGYDDPAAYAPWVAHRVEIAAGLQSERHQRGAPRERPVLPGREQQWQLLLDGLRSEGDVREVAEGRIEVQLEDEVLITVLVSADGWEQVLAEHASGDVEMYLSEVLHPRDADETFLVFWQGDMARSVREELPPVRGRSFERRMARLRAEHPDAEFRWSAY